MSQGYTIKYVAIYLRKSRGDEEKDLDGHKNDLIDLCKENDWSYTIYSEIGTSDSIELRAKMKELLSDVEQDMYDAVLCMHIDRLSRGDSVDQAIIRKTFAKAETLLVTPSQVYDYNNDQDMLMAEFQGMIARMEYKQISRRFRQGKARRAKQGIWSNGVPPFPYIRNSETGKAEPNPDQLPTYNFMKDKALNGYVPTDIAWELNKSGSKSPKGGMWQPAVIQRILLDEVHLGKIVVGKKRKHVTTGELINKPKKEWITYNNCHESVKTQQEHDKLKFLYSREIKSPKASRAGKNLFSGLVRCALCGSTLQFQKWKNRNYDTIKSCVHRDSIGNRCTNIGGSVDTLSKYLRLSITDKKIELEEAIADGLDIEEMNDLKKLSELKAKEIKDHEKIIEHIYRNHEKKIYSSNEDKNDKIFMERREIAEIELEKLTDDYSIIQKQLDNTVNAKNEDMLISIKEFLDLVNDDDIDVKVKNRSYKSMIRSISWERNSKDAIPSILVNFL